MPNRLDNSPALVDNRKTKMLLSELYVSINLCLHRYTHTEQISLSIRVQILVCVCDKRVCM